MSRSPVISWCGKRTTHGMANAPRNQKSAVFPVSWRGKQPTRSAFSLFRGVANNPLYILPGSWLPSAAHEGL